MKFSVNSSLHYDVTGPGTLVCSLSCIQTQGQQVTNESLLTSREVNRTDLWVSLVANHFTKLDITEVGPLRIDYSAEVTTSPEVVEAASLGNSASQKLDADAIPYLFPSRYVPSDRLRYLSAELFGHLNSPYAQAMAVEDWLAEHLTYTPGSSNEYSWALDTYTSGEGVCRDFAHLGIGFCRALTIPARYLTVYAYQLDPPDFHAVFEVYIDGMWYLIDGTRKAPLNGMIRIATGRDAGDAAVATIFGSIIGQEITVATAFLPETPDKTFIPITREDLRRDGMALFLG
jgi:transglutaminase-like putative cysteine protease